MKEIDELVDKLEKRVDGILKGITHGQVIDREKVKKSVKNEVIAVCKHYYRRGFGDAAFAIHEEMSVYDEPEYQESLKEGLKDTFKE